MSENENCAHTFASIIITGKDFDPEVITSSIGVTPSYSFKKGDKRGESKNWDHSFWELSSKEFETSTDLGLHIEWLVSKILPYKDQFIELSKAIQPLNTYISCFWESKTGHGGPIFSPSLLRKIADLNLELWFDIYFAD